MPETESRLASQEDTTSPLPINYGIWASARQGLCTWSWPKVQEFSCCKCKRNEIQMKNKYTSIHRSCKYCTVIGDLLSYVTHVLVLFFCDLEFTFQRVRWSEFISLVFDVLVCYVLKITPWHNELVSNVHLLVQTDLCRPSHQYSWCQTRLSDRIRKCWSYGHTCQMMFSCTFSSICLHPVCWKLPRYRNIPELLVLILYYINCAYWVSSVQALLHRCSMFHWKQFLQLFTRSSLRSWLIMTKQEYSVTWCH